MTHLHIQPIAAAARAWCPWRMNTEPCVMPAANDSVNSFSANQTQPELWLRLKALSLKVHTTHSSRAESQPVSTCSATAPKHRQDSRCMVPRLETHTGCVRYGSTLWLLIYPAYIYTLLICIFISTFLSTHAPWPMQHTRSSHYSGFLFLTAGLSVLSYADRSATGASISVTWLYFIAFSSLQDS